MSKKKNNSRKTNNTINYNYRHIVHANSWEGCDGRQRILLHDELNLMSVRKAMSKGLEKAKIGSWIYKKKMFSEVLVINWWR